MMTGIPHDTHHRRHLILTAAVAAGLAAYLTGSVTSLYGFDLAMVLALAGGFPIFCEAGRALARRQLSADLAVGLAALAALYIGQYAVAAEVVLIMLIGEALEHVAVGRTRAGIAQLLSLRPHTARVRRDGAEQVVRADEVRPDDVVIVRPGEGIPIDGTVLAGHSSVDQSPITGESLPADKTPGEKVFAGTINLHGAMELAVERLGTDTTLERIIHLVEEAESAKAPARRLADRWAAWFVPAVLLAAGVTYLTTADAVRAVAVLVIACPCALVLATPTAIAAGLGGLVRRGILVKGGAVLENLGRLRAVVFDKTGTLTLARLRIVEVVPAPGHDAADVLRFGAGVEGYSEHPIGRLLVERAASDGLDPPAATGFVARPGLGAEAVVGGAAVRVGSLRFLQEAGVAVPPALADRIAQLDASGCTVVLVSRDHEAVGAVAVADTVRPDARETVERLRGLGVERIVLLTGDHAAAAQAVGREVAIPEVRSGLLPDEKVEAIREIQAAAAPVAMVGDGVNDAPSLASADVGVAMADVGTDVAVASADVVLVGDDLGKLADAVAFGRRTLRIVWQNLLGFALVFNVLAVLAASFGWIGPVAGAVVHQVSSLVVCLNSLRLLLDVGAWRRRIGAAWDGVRRRRRRVLAGCAAAAVLVYAFSGLHVVRIGEVAVVQRFGRVVRPLEGPGLYCRLPYPFGQHQTVRPAEARRVEVGFRTMPGAFAEPPAYEWNVQHRGGRYVRQADEAAVWAGDESLVDVNLVVHYRIRDPLAALFTVGTVLPDGRAKWDALVRNVAEASLRAEMARRPVDAVLGGSRSAVEEAVADRIGRSLARGGTGLAVESVLLGDVHPPVEVVPAFREVASALEEKEADINEAEAYRNETEARVRGEAEQKRLAAQGFRQDRTMRAQGGAERFARLAEAYARSPEITRLRLYLETVEETLAGRRKVILDRVPKGAKRLILLGRTGLWNLLPATRSDADDPEGDASP